MEYREYFKLARQSYSSDKIPSFDLFYADPVKRVPTESFSSKYTKSVDHISNRVKLYFDANPTSKILNWYPSFLDFQDQLETICKELVPWLEQNTYGCHLFVDKIYIYRTSEMQNRESSYRWHYDNNPTEIVKNILYLNDVSKTNSPFEYLADKQQKRGVVFKATRTGPDNWNGAPNNSRIDNIVTELIDQNTHEAVQVLGSKGTMYSFNNDAAHRANPVIEGYRDVINIRVKPTTTKPPIYIDKKWTTDNKVSGVVDPDPEKDWKYYDKL